MTQNQVAYLNYAENKRNNMVVSDETNRHNLATEGEVNRHNIVTEGQENAKIAETGRHNLVTETQTKALNSETKRHNKVTERATRSEQRETHRHNLATEKQQKYNTDKQTAANIYATQVGAKTAANRMAVDKYINSAKLAMDDANSWRDRNTKLQVAQITTKSNEFIKSLEQGMQNAKLKQEKLLKYKELKKEYTKILADLARTEGMIAGKGLDALTGVMGNMLKILTGSKK